MQDSRYQHSAPPGAACAEHPERPATFTCPRCGNYACLFCWHPIAERCDTCLKRDPAAAAPALPWETQHGTGIQRFLRTLGSAFQPVHTAPAFARPGLRRPLAFFLLTALPLAALAGVIPNTKTLMFGSSFSVVVQGHPTPSAIALDVVVAMLMQVLIFSIDFAAIALPYTSLVRAYATPDRRGAALRVLLYRSWLAPFAALFFNLGLWMLPGGDKPDELTPLLPLLGIVQFMLHMLILSSMRASARLACGIGALMSFVVVAIPVTVFVFVQLFIARIMLLL
ncbi:MAG: hypothetical protein ABW321_19410 [Polyangiales bacterium]